MEVLKRVFVVVDSELIGLALIVNFLGDLLLYFLGELLKTSPFVEELLGLLCFFLLVDTIAGKEFERLIKLVKNESSFIILQEDGLHAILNANKNLDVIDVLVFDGGTSLSFLHELLQLFNLLLSVLDKRRSSEVIDIRRCTSNKAGSVGRSSEGLPIALVVLIGNLDVNINFSIDLVLDEIFAVIGIDDLARDLLGLIFFGLDGDLEIVTTGLTVLFLLITGLNKELNRLADSAFTHETRTKAE